MNGLTGHFLKEVPGLTDVEVPRAEADDPGRLVGIPVEPPGGVLREVAVDAGRRPI